MTFFSFLGYFTPQRDDQVSARYYSPRAWNDHDCLCVIDHNCGPVYGSTNSQAAKFKDWRIVDSTNFVKVDRISHSRAVGPDSTRLQLLELIKYRRSRVVRSRADPTDLDVVHDDTGLVQQESKLGSVSSAESIEVVVLVFAGLGEHHERGIRAVEPHVEHAFDPDSLYWKPLLLQLLLRCFSECVQPRRERWDVLWSVKS